MYVLAPWKKADPVTRWNLPDRIFFGHGACHILAGVFLKELVHASFQAFWINPPRHPGMHVFVSDGEIAFDYHGYSVLTRLEQHHQKVWRSQYPDWEGAIAPVDFDLLNESDLNQRNMRGPNQYLGDPVRRASAFLHRIDHTTAVQKAQQLIVAGTA